MTLSNKKILLNYGSHNFIEQKEALIIFSLMIFVSIYSFGMFMADIFIYHRFLFVLVEIIIMSIAMAFVFFLWYKGFMDAAILITCIYGVAFTLLILEEPFSLRFHIQLFMVLIVILIGFRRAYQYVLILAILVPVVLYRTALDSQYEIRYVLFVIMNLCMTVFVILYAKGILRKEIQIAESLKKEQETDHLTSLPNRRHYHNNLSISYKNLNAYVLFIDIDHFKNLNDKFGHARGDVVLQSFANLLKEFIDPNTHIYRWGGEEFVIIACGSNINALAIAESLRDYTESYDFGIEEAVTISIGISSNHTNGKFNPEAFREADEALYLAKNSGRNNVKTLFR